jgi:hypothetical protein
MNNTHVALACLALITVLIAAYLADVYSKCKQDARADQSCFDGRRRQLIKDRPS